jgi:hypothetical protein
VGGGWGGVAGRDGDQVVRVGLPLLLALWQVYEIYAIEAVGHAALTAHLLEEQRQCMRALARSALAADTVRSPADFAAFLRVHGKRCVTVSVSVCVCV